MDAVFTLGEWQRKLQLIGNVIVPIPESIPSDLHNDMHKAFEDLMNHKWILQVTLQQGFVQAADLEMQLGDAEKIIQETAAVYSKLSSVVYSRNRTNQRLRNERMHERLRPS